MTEADKEPDREASREEAPPLLRTWRRLYFVVLAWLALLILLFYLFSRRFAP
jgi:hypothetical protein